MRVRDALNVWPDLILAPQEPDLFRRAHNTLLAEIQAVLPIDAIKSIDEVTCKLDERQRKDPDHIAHLIKDRLARFVGRYIACSIGFAANRQLAKIVCKQDNRMGSQSGIHPSCRPRFIRYLLMTCPELARK